MKVDKLIVWSGGLDSTTLLLNNIKYNLLNKSKIETFETLYIEIENNPKKSYMEKKRRKWIKSYLKRKYNVKWKDNIVKISPICPLTSKESNWQAILYIFALLLFDTDKYNSIEFGFIRTDDFWHVKNEFETTYYNSFKTVFSLDSNIVFKYPLEWTKKYDILSLYNTDKELVDLVWVCEDENRLNNKACNKCNKCIEKIHYEYHWLNELKKLESFSKDKEKI